MIPSRKAALLYTFFEKNIDLLHLDENTDFVKQELYHYTSLKTLFCILENDSLRFSSSRFTNDSTEEKLLGEDWIKENGYESDNFIFCVSSEPDLLSQWRAYCHGGGATIGLDVAQVNAYSVLHADYDKSALYIDGDGAALPLFYTPPKYFIIQDALDIIEEIRKRLLDDTLSIHDFVPYIKHGAFSEEQERRLLFSNTHGELSKCICFRDLDNGTKLPYITVKAGHIGKLKEEDANLPMELSEKKIEDIISNNGKMFPNDVFIPACSNQEEVYNCVCKQLEKKAKENGTERRRIFCEGHLPIRSIRTAPMPDKDRICEQVRRFCQSKYWLKDVDIRVSEIPYISSLNS